jgi:hypothetical protein
MEEVRDGAEDFPLRPFAGAGRAKQQDGLVFFHDEPRAGKGSA